MLIFNCISWIIQFWKIWFLFLDNHTTLCMIYVIIKKIFFNYIIYLRLSSWCISLGEGVYYTPICSTPRFVLTLYLCVIFLCHVFSTIFHKNKYRDSYLVRYCFHKIRICHDPVSLRSWIKVKVTYSVWTRSLVGDIYSSWTVLIWIYILLKLFLKH